jgi:hypothetical protein
VIPVLKGFQLWIEEHNYQTGDLIKVMSAGPVKPKGVCFKFWDWGKCDLGGRCKYEHVFKNNVVIPEKSRLPVVCKTPQLHSDAAPVGDRKQGMDLVGGMNVADKSTAEQLRVTSIEGGLQDFRLTSDKSGSLRPSNPGQNHHHVNSAHAPTGSRSVLNQPAPSSDPQHPNPTRMEIQCDSHSVSSSRCSEPPQSNSDKAALSPHAASQEKQVSRSPCHLHTP